MMEFQKYDRDGFFLLSYEGGSYGSYDDGTLGTGSGMSTWRFNSDEGRTYFIQWYQTNERLMRAISEKEYLESQLEKAAHSRWAWTKLKRAILSSSKRKPR